MPNGSEAIDTASVGQGPPPRLGGLALALIVAGAVITAYAVHAPMPPNAVSLPYESVLRPHVLALLPQGWAFFTRSPREADYVPLRRGPDGRWHSALRAPHAEPRNAFGFARASRAQGVEIGLLAGQLTDAEWHACRVEFVDCLQQVPTVAVHNDALLPTLCGEIALAGRPPVPWAWSRSGQRVAMPGTVAHLVVSC